MENHDTFPFSFDDYEDVETIERISFHNVTFLEDFGVFKRDEVVTELRVAYDMGKIESIDLEGKVLKTQRFRAVPVS